jgi:hypothetical protein
LTSICFNCQEGPPAVKYCGGFGFSNHF